MERFPVLQILISGVMFSSSCMNGGGVKSVFPGFAYICGRCCGVGDWLRRCCSAWRSCCSKLDGAELAVEFVVVVLELELQEVVVLRVQAAWVVGMVVAAMMLLQAAVVVVVVVLVE